MIVDEDNYLAHYGTPRHSGRYPWGSGGIDEHGSRSFLATIASHRKEGMSDTDIAKFYGMTTTEFRNVSSIAKNTKRRHDQALAQKLRDNGNSNVAISKRMGIPESSVRALLKEGVADKLAVLDITKNMLKEQIDQKKYLDIGASMEYQAHVSRAKFDAAIHALEAEGYKKWYVKVPQVGAVGNFTTVKVLAAPGSSYPKLANGQDKIGQIESFLIDGGKSSSLPMPPVSIKSSRVGIVYGPDGGSKADGVMYVRHGVEDVSLGGARYAQVRVAVDGTHYIKGMAMYKDDMPPGIDILFNTNKTDTGNKLDALKPMKTIDGKKGSPIDKDNPFASSINGQQISIGPRGKKTVTSVMNRVNEEGDWNEWSRSLSSQFLSKQSPSLIRSQLDMKYESKTAEFNAIKQLTNPAVKKLLLEKFADGADSSAVNLKAAALPRQATRVILPLNSLRENEIYAPNFRNGESVVLVRHPHAGVFELPELTVNNNHKEAKAVIGNALDAVAIHPKVAEKLSGADFDGDTVIVIPNSMGKVKTAPTLAKLRDFDPKTEYKKYEGMKVMTPRETQTEMGKISNLITDMTIQRAGTDDIVRAVRHSMVVIDAEKHELDFRKSAQDNGIAALKAKYQAPSKGASTLISRASSEMRVNERRPGRVAEGGPVNIKTGEKILVPTGTHWVDKNGKTVYKQEISTKLAETKDAHTLVSKDGGTTVEKLYADHSNKLKALANSARLESLHVKPIVRSPSAKEAYAKEVKSLTASLNIALRNKPLERQAQLIANSIIDARKLENPNISNAELKKIKNSALATARTTTGAGKQHIEISKEEWNAIQAGALSNNQLKQILQNSNLDKVKELATPRTALLMDASKKSRANRMIASGYTEIEIADQLGVSLTTLKTSLNGG